MHLFNYYYKYDPMKTILFNQFIYKLVLIIFYFYKEKLLKFFFKFLKNLLIGMAIMLITLFIFFYYIYINENEIIILEYIFNLSNKNSLLHNYNYEEIKSSPSLNYYIENFLNRKKIPSYFQKDYNYLYYNKHNNINDEINIQGLMLDYIKYKYNYLLYDLILKDLRKIPILI